MCKGGPVGLFLKTPAAWLSKSELGWWGLGAETPKPPTLEFQNPVSGVGSSVTMFVLR